MGLEWFPDGWTHLWEQAYDDHAEMMRATRDEADLLKSGPITEWIDVHYVIEREEAAQEAGR